MDSADGLNDIRNIGRYEVSGSALESAPLIQLIELTVIHSVGRNKNYIWGRRHLINRHRDVIVSRRVLTEIL